MKFNIGDKVLVKRTWNENDRDNTRCGFSVLQKENVGNTLVIRDISPNGNYLLDTGYEMCYFPEKFLEKVEEDET